MNININEIFENKISELEKEGFIEKEIGEAVETCLKNCIENAFDSYQVRHDIKEKMEKEISVALKRIDLSTYNGFITQKFKDAFENAPKKDLAEKINNALKGLLEPEFTELKLSELMKAYRETFDLDDYDNHGEYFTFIMKKSEYGNTIIYIDEDEDKEGYQCEHKLMISEDGKIFSMELGRKKVEEKLRFGYMNKFEEKLFKAYFNEIPLIVDIEDEDDINTSKSDYED